MPNKHRVTVTVRAECTYEVELEGYEGDHKAQEAAIDLWRSKLPSGFQVCRDYITEWDAETEQTAYTCDECGVDIKEGDAGFGDYACPKCQAAWIVEQTERQQKLQVRI